MCQRPQACAGGAVHPGDIRGLQRRGEGALPCAEDCVEITVDESQEVIKQLLDAATENGAI